MTDPVYRENKCHLGFQNWRNKEAIIQKQSEPVTNIVAKKKKRQLRKSYCPGAHLHCAA